MKLIRRAGALLVFASLSATVVGSAASRAEAEPASAVDVFAILRQMVDDRAFARDDFYTQAELVSRFGALPEIKINEPKGIERSASVVGYGRLADVQSKSAVLPNGIFIGFGKYLWPRDAADQALICYLDADFRGFASGIDFDSVVARLGPGWRRNSKVEQDRFIAVTREPFNPPFPTPTTPMGNAIIDYGQGNRQIELEFTPSGLLYSMKTARQRC